MSNKNVIGYCRVSSKRQKNGLEVQKETIKDYCKTNKLNLLKIYEDFAVSGTIPLDERNGFKELLSNIDVDEAHNTTIIVTDFSRLTRNTDNDSPTLRTLLLLGVDIMLCSNDISLIETQSIFNKYFSLHPEIISEMKTLEIMKYFTDKNYRNKIRYDTKI